VTSFPTIWGAKHFGGQRVIQRPQIANLTLDPLSLSILTTSTQIYALEFKAHVLHFTVHGLQPFKHITIPDSCLQALQGYRSITHFRRLAKRAVLTFKLS
jgi:hypothetical protein